MVVTVKGTSTDDPNCSADSITYDNELKGPVSESVDDPLDPTRKTLTILGQAVLVTADTTIDDDGGLTFDDLVAGIVLEVSGYATDAGLLATHIELQDDETEIEIKGHIDIDSLTTDSFTIKGFPISYDGTTELDDITELAEGLFVEVEGELIDGGTILFAWEIEGEHEGLDDDVDEYEIKGPITDFNNSDGKITFKLLGQKIDASGARLEPVTLVLAEGIIVEAEGRKSGDVLIAHKVEQKGRKIKIDATVSAVGTDTVSFNFNSTDITIHVHVDTEIEDENGDPLSLSQLSGHFVELEAFGESPGVINAVEIEREEADDIRIVAQLEGFNKDARSVDLLGITFDLLNVTEFKNRADIVISANDFFDALVVGAFIKIKDRDSNAVFDRAELED